MRGRRPTKLRERASDKPNSAADSNLPSKTGSAKRSYQTQPSVGASLQNFLEKWCASCCRSAPDKMPVEPFGYERYLKLPQFATTFRDHPREASRDCTHQPGVEYFRARPLQET